MLAIGVVFLEMDFMVRRNGGPCNVVGTVEGDQGV